MVKKLTELERREAFRRAKDQEVYDMSQEALKKAELAVSSISTHERVCAERFGFIQGYMKDVKGILGWAGMGLITLLIGVIVLLLKQQGIV